MSVIKVNEVLVPAHWNDQGYEAECSKCGFEEVAKTLDELATKIENHIHRY
jgi:hypothetical protein